MFFVWWSQTKGESDEIYYVGVSDEPGFIFLERSRAKGDSGKI